LSGVFISFIAWLATLPDPGAPAAEAPGTAQAEPAAPRPRFEFFDLLPEQTIEVEEEIEPAIDISKPGASGPSEQYILQAGSFRQEEDARRRRAELILMGLNPSIRAAMDESGRLFRVYIGPFDSLESVSRARSLTTSEHIETLVLKRGEP
jgi:cell division protein FtsN